MTLDPLPPHLGDLGSFDYSGCLGDPGDLGESLPLLYGLVDPTSAEPCLVLLGMEEINLLFFVTLPFC